MSIIEYSDGTKIEFSGDPTQEDAVAAYNQVKGIKTPAPVQEAVAPKKSFLQKAAGVADTLFGGGKVGEAIGADVVKSKVLSGKAGIVEPDYSKLSPAAIARLQAKGVPTTLEGQRAETAGTVTGPSSGEVIGSALQAAALFTPVGKVAKGLTSGVRALGLSRGASALGKIGSGAIAGETFDISTNLQEGDTGADILTPGMGAGLGAAIPGASVAKKAVVKFGNNQAPRIINSLIKPLAKDFSYGKDPGRAVAEAKIVANNFDDLVTKIRDTRQKTGQSIGSLGRQLSTKPIVNIGDALLPLDDAMKVAASQNNPTLLSRLSNVKQSITSVLEPTVDETGKIGIKEVGKRKLDGLTFSEARDILGDVGDITQFTGNPSDDKIVNSALKKVYGSIKEASLNAADSINPTLAKDFRKLTERYADLSSAEVAAKYRDKIVERSNLVGLSPQIAGVGSGLVTLVATGGTALPAVLAGITGVIVQKLAATPGFKTRLAAVLSTKSPQEVSTLFQKFPVLQKFFPKGSAVSPGDRVLEQIEATPNKKGGFVSIGGKTFKSIPDATKKEMVATMDYLNQKGDKFQFDAKKDRVLNDIMKKYNINPDWSNNKIADTIEKLIENTKTS